MTCFWRIQVRPLLACLIDFRASARGHGLRPMDPGRGVREQPVHSRGSNMHLQQSPPAVELVFGV